VRAAGAIKIFGGFVALFSVAVALIPGALLGILLIAGSERSVFERVKSPDGWHEARVQFDDAGALSGFARLVFVKHDWNMSDEPLLSCRAFWGEGQAKVDLKWLTDNTLLIEHHFAPDHVEATAQNCGPVRIIARSVRPFEST